LTASPFNGIILETKGKTMEEVYTQVKGYEGLYEVSNYGNVKSLPKGDGNGNRERILRQELLNSNTHTNYRRVALSMNGIVKRYAVHRLVAEAFIENLELKPQVNHIDNNGENNHVSNLEWCTASENMKHSSNQGRQADVKRAGGVARGVLSRETLLQKLKDLNINYSSISEGGRRSFIQMICHSCNNTSTARSDSAMIGKGGYCASCIRKKKNI
jgi:hypothetical protein